MSKFQKWPKIAAAMVLGIVVAGCATGPTSAPSSQVQQRIEAAQTRTDHEALAVYYDNEAVGARAKGAEHRKMAKSYQTVQSRDSGTMAAHCSTLVRSYEGIAADYEVMAAGHRQMAGQAKP